MSRYLLSVHGPAERTESGTYPAQEVMLQAFAAADLDVALALAVEGSKACRGTVEVRPFRTAEPVRALPQP